MKKRLILLLSVCSLILSLGVVTAFAATTQQSGKGDLNYAPDVTIDYGSYSESTVPSAVKNVKYKIFTATAEDVYGKALAVTAKAYIHYGEPNASLVTIENGAIMPKHYGIYTIEYSALDEFGNVGIATYDFVCEDTVGLTLSLGGEYDSSVQAGKVAKIKTYEYANAIGEASVRVSASLGSTVSYDLTGKTSFVPLYEGQYTITYFLEDYSRSTSTSYSLSVTSNSGAVIFTEPTLPKYFIVNKTYTLPTAECYNLSSGSPVQVNPTISVKYGAESYSALSGNTFSVTKAGNVTIKYAVSGDQREYTAKAINTGITSTLDMAKYFNSSTAVFTKTSNYITAEAKTEGEKVEFINPLESHRFEFTFSIPSDYKNFDKLNLFLESSKDSSNVLKITYQKINDKSSYVIINDRYRYKSNESFSLEGSIDVIYLDQTRTLRFGQSLTIDLSAIEGFDDERVYFSFSLEGLNGKSGINLVKISNQALTSANGDGVEPRVYFDTYPKGYETVGKTVTVGRVFICDVLDPDYTVSYSIKKPSGGYVVDVNGVTLNESNADYRKDYTFVASEYGKYVVRMAVVDSSENEELYTYNVVVADFEGPKVTVKRFKDNLQVGEAFTVKTLTITDNKSTNFNVSAYVIKPNMQTVSVTVGSAYAFKTAGQYVLCYVVKDDAGNVTILTHTFIVG